MKHIYLFDVDGTLTPPRLPMNKKFSEFFYDFVSSHDVVLISGSDYKKISEQVPKEILDICNGVYGCSGAEYYEKGTMLYSKLHQFPDELLALCNRYIDKSKYQLRCGIHIEERPGMLNISTVGRNATNEQRKSYNAWDNQSKERLAFVEKINKSSLPYEASAGGEISIDIVPSGWNKSVVKNEVLNKHPDASLIFFGDRIVEGGNDLPLAEALKTPIGLHSSHQVNSYHDTWELLEVRTAISKARVA